MTPPLRKRRPSGGFEAAEAEAASESTGYVVNAIGERETSPKRARKLRRAIPEA